MEFVLRGSAQLANLALTLLRIILPTWTLQNKNHKLILKVQRQCVLGRECIFLGRSDVLFISSRDKPSRINSPGSDD